MSCLNFSSAASVNQNRPAGATVVTTADSPDARAAGRSTAMILSSSSRGMSGKNMSSAAAPSIVMPSANGAQRAAGPVGTGVLGSLPAAVAPGPVVALGAHALSAASPVPINTSRRRSIAHDYIDHAPDNATRATRGI